MSFPAKIVLEIDKLLLPRDEYQLCQAFPKVDAQIFKDKLFKKSPEFESGVSNAPFSTIYHLLVADVSYSMLQNGNPHQLILQRLCKFEQRTDNVILNDDLSSLKSLLALGVSINSTDSQGLSIVNKLLDRNSEMFIRSVVEKMVNVPVFVPQYLFLTLLIPLIELGANLSNQDKEILWRMFNNARVSPNHLIQQEIETLETILKTIRNIQDYMVTLASGSAARYYNEDQTESMLRELLTKCSQTENCDMDDLMVELERKVQPPNAIFNNVLDRVYWNPETGLKMVFDKLKLSKMGILIGGGRKYSNKPKKRRNMSRRRR